MLNIPLHETSHKSRLLFVDDEVEILNGYAAALGQSKMDKGQYSRDHGRLSELSSQLFGDAPIDSPTSEFELCLCHQAIDAIKAVEHAAHVQRPFAAAFIDIRLPPGPDGVTLAEFIRAIDPHINIIIVTGFSDLSPEDITKRIPPTDRLLYCQKPLHTAEVRQLAASMSAKWLAEKHLFAARTQMEHVLSSTKVVLYGCGSTRPGHITFISENVAAVFGYRAHDFIEHPELFNGCIHPEDRIMRQTALAELGDGGGNAATVYRFQAAEGDWRWVSDQVKLVCAGPDQPSEQVGCLIDITDRRHDEDRIRYLAYHDSLTGLPNRALMRMMLDRTLAVAARYERTVAVLYLDLDHFKSVNDSHGHAVGDELLKEAARRIGSVVRSGDTVSPNIGEEVYDGSMVSRLGGDEFVVILTDIGCPVDAALVARRIREVLVPPFIIGAEGEEVAVSASIGISLCPDDGTDAETLLNRADKAMYLSKDNGRNTTNFFTKQLGEKAERRLTLETKMQRSLYSGDFSLQYQPKIDIANDTIIGVEALLRWTHPELGVIAPSEFIPVAESSGLIIQIGEFVLREAMLQAKRWLATGISPLMVAVNVSALQFRQQGLIERIKSLLLETGLPANYLTLELTEGVLIGDEDSVRLLNQIGDLGIQLSIDDFGTGYSSLSYLQRFPVKELKIDQAFIRDIHDNTKDAAIVRAAIALGHSLGIRIVAEGVENKAQMAFLREHSCDEAQGYYISRPLTVELFEPWCLRYSKINTPAIRNKSPALRLV